MWSLNDEWGDDNKNDKYKFDVVSIIYIFLMIGIFLKIVLIFFIAQISPREN